MMPLRGYRFPWPRPGQSLSDMIHIQQDIFACDNCSLTGLRKLFSFIYFLICFFPKIGLNLFMRICPHPVVHSFLAHVAANTLFSIYTLSNTCFGNGTTAASMGLCTALRDCDIEKTGPEIDIFEICPFFSNDIFIWFLNPIWITISKYWEEYVLCFCLVICVSIVLKNKNVQKGQCPKIDRRPEEKPNWHTISWAFRSHSPGSGFIYYLLSV